MIDQEMLKAYQRRWQAVADMEALERQRETVTQRWRKLNSLMRMAAGLGLRPYGDDQQDEDARRRWNRLTVVNFRRGLWLWAPDPLLERNPLVTEQECPLDGSSATQIA